jgi:hypothetical protein
MVQSQICGILLRTSSAYNEGTPEDWQMGRGRTDQARYAEIS